MTDNPGAPLKFRGSTHFRTRIALATLSSRSIVIDRIRDNDEALGLRDYEMNLLQLLDSLCNGSTVTINETGTRLVYRPGVISGGRIEFDCGTSRGIGYYIEAILMLAPFAKTPVIATLKGITNTESDLSVDSIRSMLLPSITYFGLAEGLQLTVKRRGAPPSGGGLVELRVPTVRQLKPINFCDPGYIKRVRGVAYTCKVSPQVSNRMVDSARALLNEFIPDVRIFTDHNKGKDAGNSPGFGISLVAESTSGALLCAERCAKIGERERPEDLGAEVSQLLCEEISTGGCVATCSQPIMLLFMALASEDVSKIRFGVISNNSIAMLRHLKALLGVTFNLKPDEKSKTTVLSCVGTGYKNIAKKVT